MSNLEKFTAGFEDRRLVERFTELISEVQSRAETAEPGTVIDAIERTLLLGGRELFRSVAEQEIQAAADAAEKKGRATVRNAASGGVTKVRKSAT